MLCLTCFTIPLYALLLIVVYQIYRFFIRPNKKLQTYRDQGIPTSFAPYHGFFKQVGIDLSKHGDMYYSWKQVNSMNPKPKAFASNFFDAPLVALKDPELIKQFFQAQEKSYIKAPGAINVAKMILRNGTLLSEGETWKIHRKLTSPLFSYDSLRERIPEMAKIADAAWDRLKAKDSKSIDMLKETQHVLLEISGKLFLDIELHKLEFKGQTVSSFVAELIDRAALESFNPFTVMFSTSVVGLGIHPRHKALVKDINDLRGFLYGAAKAKLGEILEQRKNNPTQTKLPLLLEVLYDQFVKLPKDNLDEVDLVDEFANFVLGSMDTTGHTILFASYFFMDTPSFQKQLLEEVNRTFKNPAEVTLDSLNNMNNMSAFIKEVLRMTPPLPHFLPRQAVNDHQLGDLKITAGTVVVAAGVTNSYDSDYHDDADKFVPERWLDENSKTRKSVAKNAYVYIPFSTGVRACPGKEIGLNLTKIVFSLFLKKFNYSHADKNYKMAFASKLFHEPLHPLTYSLTAK